MKQLIKFILKNYFQALAVLLIIFGIILWFKPEDALELIVTLTPLSILMKIWILFILNLSWSIWFIIFDIWNSYRVHGIDKDV